MPEKAILWIWFSLINGLNNLNLQKLIAYCGGYETLWNAKTEQDLPDFLHELKEWKPLLMGLLDQDLKVSAQRVFDLCRKSQIGLTFPGAIDYPHLLEYIPDKPMILYVRGTLKKTENLLAIIGSRNASSYGLDIAYSFARKLTENGITIVSGMARGVDTYAHAGALKSKGRTIAVLGCGVDFVYPRENNILMDKIIQNGAVLSEYPPGTRPTKYSFPQRNRIIAGMSIGVFVTEAGPDSGTRKTVDDACEYGKEIFAVPGEITKQNFFGTNKMLKDGAHFVTTPDDIFIAIKDNYQTPEGLLENGSNNIDFGVPASIKSELSEVELGIVSNLEVESMHIDKLISNLDLELSEVYVWLLMLEMKGIISQLPGRFYKIKNTFI